MSKILRLFNTFTRETRNVELGGTLIRAKTIGDSDAKLIRGSLYICGPTVYSDSHLGHAITYVRADLFRRIMRLLFDVRLTTVMNITDIDDKILVKAMEMYYADGAQTRGGHDNETNQVPATIPTDPRQHPFNKVSEKYHNTFVRDMEAIRVLPADLTIKITRQMPLIINYIRRLERSGHAYVSENGDVHFDVRSLKNYRGNIDERKSGSFEVSKRDPRDFVLWKAAKPNEPVWLYESDVTGRTIPGRPGWHVQCSAIANSIFGSKLDFHFGGNDLVFPHHYNEEACCCAYHELDTSESIHVWSKHWLHSGHMTLKDEKMSKSLGNVIAIDNFIGRSSVNALRLLCISTHYRANIEFSESLLNNLKSLDHRLSAFNSYLSDELSRALETGELKDCTDENEDGDSSVADAACRDVESDIQLAYDDFVDGVCDDLDLERGLQSILRLAQLVYAKGAQNIRPTNLVLIRQILTDWFNLCGLEYGHAGVAASASLDRILLDLIQEHRNSVRSLVVNQLKRKQSSYDEHRQTLQSILIECDKVRTQLDESGFVLRDKKI